MNAQKENNLNFDRNFNRKSTRHTPEMRDGILRGNPHTLFNKFSDSEMRFKPLKEEKVEIDNSGEKVSKTALKIDSKGIIDGWLRYKEKIVTPHGTIYIEDICVTA